VVHTHLTWNQLDEFSSLTSIRDPFDRLIVSAARSTGAKLITKDESLADSGLVDVVWS
jgi:PIN domain nuclease of toxin-antitoxin system